VATQEVTDELPIGRLEAFSDGVFAIAITLLVLELAISHSAGPHLLRAILDQWPSYLAYVTSFFTIGVIWLKHAAITNALRAGDATLYRLNLVVLFVVALLPYPTKIVGEFIGERSPERVAVVFYGLALLVLDLAMTAFTRYGAQRRQLVKDDVAEERIEAAVGQQPSYAFYVGAIAVGYFFPTAGVILYLVIAIAVGVPVRTLRRVLLRRG